MYVHKTPPTPPQNTPFSGLNLKVGKTNYCLCNLDPTGHCGQNIWKVGKTFLEVGKKKLFMYVEYACRQIENQIVLFCIQVIKFLNKGFSAWSDDNSMGPQSSSWISALAAAEFEWEQWRFASTKHKAHNLYTWFSARRRIVAVSGWLEIPPLHNVIGESKVSWAALHGPLPYLEKRICVSTSLMPSDASCMHQDSVEDTRHIHW